MWEPQKVGSIWLFAHTPCWLVFVGVVALSTGMVLLIRQLTEGEVYDKARSSTPGDMFLATYCAVIAWICQHDLPIGLHMWPLWHIGVSVIVMAAAIVLHANAIIQGGASRRWTMLPTQQYHNFVVVPCLSYLIVSTLPIVFCHSHFWLSFASFVCLIAWAGLVAWDVGNDNMVQR